LEFAYIAAIVVYVFVCFFLILVVLLQQGKGADIAGAFGGGGSQTAFGARSATTILHKLTTVAFIGFIVLALLLTMLEARPRSSVVKTLPQKAATQKAPAPLPRPAGAVVPVPAQPATGAPVAPPPAAPAPAPANPSGGPAKP
jgi:preprotein translocase subunit SecG